ncbi:MAG TPA: HupE/UreJ family protein, partial [Candidatus Sulfotelmatobacter sp.]
MSRASESRLPIYAFAFFTFIMCAVPAEAHLNSTGMGPFYDGSAHFLMSVEHIFPVLALALLAGLRGAAFGRRALFVLPTAWLLGGLFGLTAAATKGNALLAAVWFLVLGALLAANVKLSLRMITVLAASVGVYHGYLNG